VGALGNTNFNKASVARNPHGSIRCVAIATRRRYRKSLLSHHTILTRHHYKRLNSHQRRSRSVTLDSSNTEANQTAALKPQLVWRSACLHQLRKPEQCEGSTVTRSRISAADNNKAIDESTRSGLERFRYTSTEVELAESFGGGSEYFPFWRPLVWPLSLIRLFGQEDE